MRVAWTVCVGAIALALASCDCSGIILGDASTSADPMGELGDPTGEEIPDLPDEDSDNDGVTDEEERRLGTDPHDEDSDSDGVCDLGELAFETDPTDPTSTKSPEDFYVILEFMSEEHLLLPLVTVNTGTSVIDVSVVAGDEPDDPAELDYDSTAFIKDITPVRGWPLPPEGYSGMDGDVYQGVEPGTRLTLEIDFYNNTMPPGDHGALAFKAWLVVLADGERAMERRKVVVIVPWEGREDLGP